MQYYSSRTPSLGSASSRECLQQPGWEGADAATEGRKYLCLLELAFASGAGRTHSQSPIHHTTRTDLATADVYKGLQRRFFVGEKEEMPHAPSALLRRVWDSKRGLPLGLVPVGQYPPCPTH